MPLLLYQVMLVAKPVRLPLSMLILQFPVAIQLLVGVRISEFIVPFDKKPPVPVWFEVLLAALAGPCSAAGPAALAGPCSAAAGPEIFCGLMKYGIIGEK